MNLDGLIQGFGVALSAQNLLFLLFGVLGGMIIGVLPGLGSTATVALLLPMTYGMSPEGAIILLAGIYYGSMYGGTITSVLLRLPGEASTVVTTFDGYQMAQQGRAGPALGIAAIGSFIGGTVAVIGLTFFAPMLGELALRFGPPEFAALAALGITLVCYLGRTSLVKSLVAAAAGLLLATVGQDLLTGETRFTFGSLQLTGGIDFVALAMGMFGISEILLNVERTEAGGRVVAKVSRAWVSLRDLTAAKGAIARGTVLGFVLGMLPGGGGVVSSLASYALEKRRAKDPSRFGRGAIEGVAGPETANNAASTASFIPLLTLGIPSNAVLALIFGALLLQGVPPGPGLINEQPAIFWGVIASMYLGNALLLLLNLPLVGVFVRMLQVRASILAPIAVAVTMVGVYSVNNNIFGMWLVIIFGVLGYLMRKTGFDAGPLVLAFVIGPILETSVRQSLIISNGDASIFVTRPIAGTICSVIGLLLVLAFVGWLRRHRRGAVTVASSVDPEHATPADRASNESRNPEDP